MRSRQQPGPFQVLRQVFLTRLVDFELLAADGDTSKLIGAFATLLAGISLAITIPLIIINGLPQELLWGMEHFLIAITMALGGLFGVMSWESIFPERKDIVILGPLPVRRSTLFLAKLSAMATALGLAILALNCFTGLGWALQFEPAHGGILGLVHSIGAYWATVGLAGIFVFCCILTVQGLISLLPRQVSLRLSGVLQVAGFIVVLGDFILEPSFESISALGAAQNQHLLHCLPSYWFWGLFQQLNGSTGGAAHAAFVSLSRRAWGGLALMAAGALTSVLTAYLRTMPRIVEDPEIQPVTRGWARKLPDKGEPLRRAILEFSWRTLMRSRQHRLLLGFFLGTGLTVILLYLKTPVASQAMADGVGNLNSPFLGATLVVISLVVLGARLVVGIPITLKANWIFQLTQIHPPEVYLLAGRLALFTIGVLPIWIAIAGLTFWTRGGWPMAVHLVVLALLGVALVDVSMFTLRKLPFACSWMPGRANLVAIFFGGVIVGLPLAMYAGKYEVELLRASWGWTWLLLGACLVAFVSRWCLTLTARMRETLLFEEEEPPVLVSLGLRD